MRRIWMGIVLLGLGIAASARLGGTETSAAKSATTAAPAKNAANPAEAEAARKSEPGKSDQAASRESSAVEIELQHLKGLIQEQSKELAAQRALLREQQQKLAALEQRLAQQAPPTGLAVYRPATAAFGQAREQEQDRPSDLKLIEGQLEAVADSTKELGQKVGKLEKDVSETKKSTEGRLRALGNFSFSGDLRIRYEPFFGGGPLASPAPPDRHRERFRLRFNANAKFSEEFSGGMTIASGDPGDPISTNQTFTNFFQRKPILIDKAFVTYTPRWFKPLSVTGGKWGYTWYHTEMTWDNDLNPEGVSEAVSFNLKTPMLNRIALLAYQTAFNEVSGGPDSAMYGGQLQTSWKLHDRLKFSGNVAYYHYRNPDSIAANQGPGTGSTGLLAGNNNTNAFGVINGSRVFASKFGILDTIARFDLDTRISRFPLMLLLNFAQNTQACQNSGAFTAAGVTPPVCNPRDRQAYWAEVQFGRTQEQGEMRLGYTFIRIEREAVVSAFSFSDLRQATNVANHRVEYAYQAYKNITLSFTGLIGRQLVTAATPARERFLKRFQFDVIYKF